jgi:integrase
VAIYRVDGCQRKEFAATFREARDIKIRCTAEEAGRRAGPTLHAYALQWVDHYAGRGANDVINDRTRREYRRLLITYALAYFEPGERLRDIDEQRARSCVDWLCRLTDETGHRLCDRSVHNAVLPLQCRLRHAARAGLLGDGAEPVILLPRRRRGRAYAFDERRFLTREQLARLLAEIPDSWRPFFELLASTGLRISEAIALRITDVELVGDQPRIHVRRAIVDGQLTGPKSRHGRRTIPISYELAKRLAALAVDRAETDLLFVGAQGAVLRPGNVRYRVMIPAASARACRGRDFTRCATPARHCSSTPAPARFAYSAGWATTPPRSPSTTTVTCLMTPSGHRSRCELSFELADLSLASIRLTV